MQVISFSDTHSSSPFSECVLIFLGLETPDATNIDEAFFGWAQRNVAPPTVLIVGEASKMQAFAQQNITPDGKFPTLPRVGKHSEIVIAGFAYTGVIETIEMANTPAKDVTDVFYVAVQSFISQQIEHGEVVVPAPPGFYFDKLSGRFASHFIRAEALLLNSACIEMLALRILMPFDSWYQARQKGAPTVGIYIDTMGVWPVAEKLTQLHALHNRTGVNCVIESFRSYDGMKDWDAGHRLPFVLISASTSGGLAAEVRKKLGGVNPEIWTLITLASEDNGTQSEKQPEQKAAYRLSRKLQGTPALDGLRAEFETNIVAIPLGDETISIMGERFLSQSAKPKRIRLAHASLDSKTKLTLSELAKRHVIKVARGRFDAQSRWTISFDYKKLFDMSDLLLKQWLRNYSAPGPVAIIYPSSDGASAHEVAQAAFDLAQKTEDILTPLLPGASIFLMSSNQLANSSKKPPFPLSTCSVIVVAPVIGNGFTFKQISAELRRVQPTGPRLFIALAALPETHAHFEQLKSDITLPGDDRFYAFKCHFSIPIGRLDAAVQWAQEMELLDQLEEQVAESGLVAPFIQPRVEQLRELKGLKESEVFLPSANNNALLLSTGFFLWPESTTIAGDNYGGAVLLSIAALLQASRVAASKSDATSLKTGLFQHALLCPETFTRFNDPVIQAALLRAAYPSELNYSVSPEASQDMSRLLIKWLEYAHQPVGAGAAEFLLAIAIKKLKLCDRHLTQVLEKASGLGGWVGCLGQIAIKRLR